MEKILTYVIAAICTISVVVTVSSWQKVQKAKQIADEVQLASDVALPTNSLIGERYQAAQQDEAEAMKAAAAMSFADSLNTISGNFSNTAGNIEASVNRLESAVGALSIPAIDMDLLAEKVGNRVEGNIIARMNALFAEQNEMLAKNYKTPTLEEIATAVAAKVAGTNRVSYSTPTMQNAQGTITHINGVPVGQSTTYPSLNQPVYSQRVYSAPIYRAPTYYYRGSSCGPGGCR